MSSVEVQPIYRDQLGVGLDSNHERVVTQFVGLAVFLLELLVHYSTYAEEQEYGLHALLHHSVRRSQMNGTLGQLYESRWQW